MSINSTQNINVFIDKISRRLSSDFQVYKQQGVTILNLEKHDTTLIIYPAFTTLRLPNIGKRTIHLDDDQIMNHSEKIVARLASLLGQGDTIFARNTVIARVDKRVTLEFLTEHHLQSALPGKYRYGLFYQGELLSIAVFSGGRHMRDQASDYRSFELLRFCHKSGYRVVGGLSKLIKAFAKDFQPNDIMTYVDNDWSRDSSLQTIGFQERGLSLPQQFWIANHERHSFRTPEQLQTLRINLPNGYLIENQGSTKLVLQL
ncbi:hypothetical protein [Sphingobacterium sp. LRF_L2]|uniref:hypothetical protein n=1 Tax=Sphingobacterium sp. LRF_L2 TaxID=3369421 RepID=UPI003F610BE7